MGKKSFVRTIVLLTILTLVLAMASQTTSALTVKNVRTWYWEDDAEVTATVTGDVDGDGKNEIITGGTIWQFTNGAGEVAQLCVWDATTLILENVKTWQWGNYGETSIYSVAVGDVDGDNKNEIVTGGTYYERGVGEVAQLCVWDGATLTLKNVRTWNSSYTWITSLAVGDVDADGKNEIITGGYHWGYFATVAQLCIWDGTTLALRNMREWYWTDDTYILSVAFGDVDADGKNEIITGGHYWGYDTYGSNTAFAQLCVWDGATLSLENVKTWYWGTGAYIRSVAVGDVDGDGKNEIITGGNYGGYNYEGVSVSIAQLCVWNGATLALKNVQTWYWTDDTYIRSVVVGDVDGDGKNEIITGGYYDSSSLFDYVAQLCVWSQ